MGTWGQETEGIRVKGSFEIREDNFEKVLKWMGASKITMFVEGQNGNSSRKR